MGKKSLFRMRPLILTLNSRYLRPIPNNLARIINMYGERGEIQARDQRGNPLDTIFIKLNFSHDFKINDPIDMVKRSYHIKFY